MKKGTESIKVDHTLTNMQPTEATKRELYARAMANLTGFSSIELEDAGGEDVVIVLDATLGEYVWLDFDVLDLQDRGNLDYYRWQLWNMDDNSRGHIRSALGHTATQEEVQSFVNTARVLIYKPQAS